jgi:hypothetical protein
MVGATVVRGMPVACATSLALTPGRSRTTVRIASRFAPDAARRRRACARCRDRRVERRAGCPADLRLLRPERGERILETPVLLMRGRSRPLAITDLAQDSRQQILGHSGHPAGSPQDARTRLTRWIPDRARSASRLACMLVPAIQSVRYDGHPRHGSPRPCGGCCRGHIHVSWASGWFGSSAPSPPREWVRTFPTGWSPVAARRLARGPLPTLRKTPAFFESRSEPSGSGDDSRSSLAGASYASTQTPASGLER